MPRLQSGASRPLMADSRRGARLRIRRSPKFFGRPPKHFGGNRTVRAFATSSVPGTPGNALESTRRSALARRLLLLRSVRPRAGPIRTPPETPHVTPQRPLLLREADPLSQALLVRVFVAVPKVRAELGDCPPRAAASQRQVEGTAC